jgi:hypothetical protein
MPAALWMVFAVTAMVALFAGCVVVVVAGIRLLEAAREKRRRKEGA